MQTLNLLQEEKINTYIHKLYLYAKYAKGGKYGDFKKRGGGTQLQAASGRALEDNVN